MRFCTAAILLIFVSQGVFAAIPKRPKVSVSAGYSKFLKKDIEVVLEALKLPSPSRRRALSHFGVKSFGPLKKLSRDEKQSLNVRWRAVTSIGSHFPKKGKTFLVQLTKSNKWYLRNAALVSMQSISQKLAEKHAVLLLEDPALVVRTAAVEILKDSENQKYKSLLWKQLKNPKNFHKGQSLWVRPKIIQALAQKRKLSDQRMFMAHLKDKDPKVQAWAVYSLESLLNLKKAHKGLTFEQRIAKLK